MNAFEVGKGISIGLRKIRFNPSTPNFEALTHLPAFPFETWSQSNDMIERGEVRKMPDDNVSKYLYQGDVRGDRPPNTEPQCKLFRHAGHDGTLEWIEEEFCMRGFIRKYNDVLYEVIVDRVDDKTVPPNSTSWRVFVAE